MIQKMSKLRKLETKGIEPAIKEEKGLKKVVKKLIPSLKRKHNNARQICK